MADITNPTTNVTIFNGDNPDLDQAITGTTDSEGKVRLDTNTRLNADLTETEGGQEYQFVKDVETNNLLRDILKQLLILNRHMTIVSDEDIRSQDIEQTR